MARSRHRRSPPRALALYRPASKPIVIRTTKVVKAKKHHRRHGHGGGMMGGLMNKERLMLVGGAFVVGLLEKQGFVQSLPKLPLLGTLGTIGVGAYVLSNGGRNKLANDISTAAFVLAAHELAATGAIVGDGGVEGVEYVAGY